MKKELLQEGAVAGHMNHIYDNGEMTFGELKQLLQAAVDGKLRGTEKTDGQNVYLSFDVSSQKARAIRNKTHILAGGLDVEQFDEFFSSHPNQALRYSFVEALQAFEDIIRELDKSTQLKIFGTKKDNIYFNTEVMNPGTPDLEQGDPRGQGTTNVIPYDKKTLLIHAVGHDKFHPKTALSLTAKNLGPDAVDLTSNYELLERSLIGKGTDDPGTFSVETHPQRKLNPAGQKRAGGLLDHTIDAINNIVSDFGLNDSSTIQDLVMIQIKPIIDAFGLTEDRNKLLVQRLMGLCRSLKDPTKLIPCGLKDPVTKKPLHEPRPRMKDIAAGIPQELRDEIKEFDDNFKYQNYTAALSSSLYEFTNAILQDFHSSFISDNSAIIKKLQNDISDSINKIQNSANEAAKEDLKKQLSKLKDVKNINTPSEGFVFDFNGATYKFTGWFAPSNQILGTERYNRFGPIESPEKNTDKIASEAQPTSIAIIPGSFKPPHVGHLKLAEALSEGGRKLNTGTQGVVEYIPPVEKIYILVSAPVLNSRPFPNSGKVMSAEESVQIWNAYLDNSPIRNKTEVLVSPHSSPMLPVYDFVTGEADVTNKFIAPKGSTVVLGVSNKGDDWKRYGGIISKSQQSRKDLEVYDVIVKASEHSGEYNQALAARQDIKSLMKNNSHEYNASDMRTMIDLATQDIGALELLSDFVPESVDALAVLGILGLNPKDEEPSEEDQVQEPELDNLSEIVKQEFERIWESFRAPKAPAAGPASGKFQKTMKRRLSRAHRTYLDLGRKDLTKYGGAFHLDRPKGASNAFIAESESNIEEISTAGSIQVGPAKSTPPVQRVAKDKTTKKKNHDKNKKRKNKMSTQMQEKKLRMKIRKNLEKFFEMKSKTQKQQVSKLLEEHQLRLKLREIILNDALNEQEDPTTDISDNTGINTLKDLLKNTNVLSSLRDVFKTLTTSEDQRESFRAHVIAWIQDTLAPVKLNDIDSEGSNQIAEQENLDIGVDIEGVNDEDREKFIDASDGSEKDQPKQPEEEDELKKISGKDTTGRNKAERIYPNIEKSIVDYYGELDNPEDQEMFYDYLIANMKLYFDKWTGEMSAQAPEEPTNDQYDQAKETEEAPGLSAV